MKKIPIISVIVILAALAIAVIACGTTASPISPVETTEPAVKLVFTTEPAGSSAGRSLTVQPVVRVEDASGNAVSGYNLPISLAITPGTGGEGAALFGGRTVIPVNGIATFEDLSINIAGSGYKLTATSGNLSSATSDAFNIGPGAAARLIFIDRPAAAVAGSAFGAKVAVTDAFGNMLTESNIPVTIYAMPTGTAMFGTTTANTENGVATFSGLSINKASTDYKLVAASSGLTSDTSGSFEVTAGAAVKLGFVIQPSGAIANSIFSSQPAVWVEDAYGNLVKSNGSSISVTVSITPGTGTSGAVLSGTTTMNAVSEGSGIVLSGAAIYRDLSIDLAGSSYTLTATSPGLTPATSDAFDVASSTP